MAGAVLYKFGFSPEALFAKATQVHPKKVAIMEPGSLISNPLFDTDTYTGFSGGDIAPFVPGSRFQIFD